MMAWNVSCYWMGQEDGMTSTERAVRKASRERLLRDFARAARLVSVTGRDVYGYRADVAAWSESVLYLAANESSRTRYACLMTAFGQ